MLTVRLRAVHVLSCVTRSHWDREPICDTITSLFLSGRCVGFDRDHPDVCIMLADSPQTSSKQADDTGQDFSFAFEVTSYLFWPCD